MHEIGLEGSDSAALSLAFAAYGTSSPPPRYPDVAYNPIENNYLAAYYHNAFYFEEGYRGAAVQLIDASGTPGQPVQLAVFDGSGQSDSIKVSYSGADEREYLVVWTQREPRTDGEYYFTRINGRFVDRYGNPTGNVFPISELNISAYHPAIAYDPVFDRFLVVWSEQPGSTSSICGRFISADGQFVGGPVNMGEKFTVLANTGNFNVSPAIAFDGNNRYMLVYAHHITSPQSTLYGLALDEEGAALGDRFVINNPSHIRSFYPKVAYDRHTQRFLCIWGATTDNVSYFFRGRLFETNGNPVSDDFEVKSGGGSYPALVYNDNRQNYVVTWYEGDYWDCEVYWRQISAEGELPGDIQKISTTSNYAAFPSIACNSSDGSCLLAFEHGTGYDEAALIAYELILAPAAPPVEPDSPLQVISTVPSRGASGVSPSTDIRITFNRSVYESVYFNDITISTGSTVVDYVYNINGSTLTLNPRENLTRGAWYTVYLPEASVMDADENNLSDPYNFSFKVSLPVSPGGGGGTSALVIGKTNPPDGTVGTACTHTFTAGGGTKPYTFKVSAGTLPTGLMLAENGTLSGTPAAADTWKYTVTVTDRAGRTSSHTFTHTIKEGVSAPVPAKKRIIILTVDSLRATVDGEPYTLDAAPFIDTEASRTLVPIRFISEGLGAEVDWNPAKQQVIISDAGREIILTIGSKNVLVDGQPITIDCAPVVIPPGRTFVPLRFVSETLGARVDWQAVTNTITITR